MSIKTNTTSLQSLLEQVNALPEAGGAVQKVNGTFTLGNTMLEEVSVDCGFKPDIVIIPIIDEDSQMYTICFPFFEFSNMEYLVSGGLEGMAIGMAQATDTGFLIMIVNSESQTCNYIAIKYT